MLARLVKHPRRYASSLSLDPRLVFKARRQCQQRRNWRSLREFIMLKNLEKTEIERPVTERLVFDSGRPLLLLPNWSLDGRVDNVAIGWDGSATAARACRPLLLPSGSACKATTVRVKDAAAAGHELVVCLVDSLGRASLDVTLASMTSDGDDATSTIQETATKPLCDILIAGAFRHSRLRETFVGGVTRGLLPTLGLPPCSLTDTASSRPRKRRCTGP